MSSSIWKFSFSHSLARDVRRNNGFTGTKQECIAVDGTVDSVVRLQPLAHSLSVALSSCCLSVSLRDSTVNGGVPCVRLTMALGDWFAHSSVHTCRYTCTVHSNESASARPAHGRGYAARVHPNIQRHRMQANLSTRQLVDHNWHCNPLSPAHATTRRHVIMPPPNLSDDVIPRCQSPRSTANTPRACRAHKTSPASPLTA